MSFEDYDIEDVACPECGNDFTHSRRCINIHCEDGFIDEFQFDPINHPQEGADLSGCEDCKETGIERWCPKCGAELSGMKVEQDYEDDNQIF